LALVFVFILLQYLFGLLEQLWSYLLRFCFFHSNLSTGWKECLQCDYFCVKYNVKGWVD